MARPLWLRRPTLIVRSVLLVVFVVFLVYATFFAQWRPHSLADVKDDLNSFGPGTAPVLTILLQSIGVVLLIPGMILMIATALIFGLDSIWINLAGQTLGAVFAYLIARYVGHEPLSAILGQRLLAVERALEDHAFRTLVMLRLLSLLPGPFIVYAPGLVRVNLRQVTGAAILGQIPLVVALGLVGDRLNRIREASDLLKPEFFASFAFLFAVFAVPLVVLLVIHRRRQVRRGAKKAHTSTSPEP